MFFDISAKGSWKGSSGYWTFVPNTPDNKGTGTELVSGPPHAVADKAADGPYYPCPCDGITYQTWLVPGPTHPALQQIVRWDSPLPALG
jgi:hypothetical protein